MHIFFITVGVCLLECDPEVLGPSPSSRGGPGVVGVANGMVTYNGVTSGSVATLSCDTGSSVANNYSRTCMSDGHWSEGTLSCVQDPFPGKIDTLFKLK